MHCKILVICSNFFKAAMYIPYICGLQQLLGFNPNRAEQRGFHPPPINLLIKFNLQNFFLQGYYKAVIANILRFLIW
ncbi:MAG: hypothetical protein A2096_13590 [Spirochaetes bacterium GWF1_41_5]|nr:MAG: hypothetical protein A2096_13590 [Spirochaetes bacterium GWF1_41_5]HBE02943.1 hypothetical protein [Spirochaetia bacterium]